MSQRLKKLSNLSLLAALLLSLSAHATQRVEGATDRHVEVSVSAKEQNRLAVAGRQIVTVVPSAKGAISYQKDEVMGALYFSLSGNAPEGSTVTLFVGDDQGQTYKIILVPRSIPGEEIVLQPPRTRDVSAAAGPGTSNKTLSYQRRAKEMTLLMADESPRGSTQKTDVNQEVPLWKEGRLLFRSKLMAEGVVGERYRLTNVSPSPMVLAEQELYRAGVRTVSIEFHTLAPGEGTDIYIVRDRKSNE